LITLYSSLLAYNTLYVIPLSTGIGVLGGLSQTTLLSQSIEISPLFFQTHEILSSLSFFVPIMIYPNAEIDKSRILSDTKGKTGIYMWVHLESGKRYVGSAFDISKRLSNYFNQSYLNGRNSMYISKALLFHGYSSFSLTIFEFIDISNLPLGQAKKLILEFEQFNMDSLEPEYNILKVAGSSLGYKHTEGSLTKRSIAMSGENHPRGMLGKTHLIETLAKMSEAKKGENHPMFGKTHSIETIGKMSEAKIGKTRSAETKALISLSLNKKIIVYSFDTEMKETIFYKSFDSRTETSKYFNCCNATISRYLDKNKLFKKQYILSTFLITKK
jgi:group I intron endonuclease